MKWTKTCHKSRHQTKMITTHPYEIKWELNNNSESNRVLLQLKKWELNNSSGESKGGARDARLPLGPNSFIFMQFSGKF